MPAEEVRTDLSTKYPCGAFTWRICSAGIFRQRSTDTRSDDALVQNAAAFGINQADIANQLNIDEKTLRKHFRERRTADEAKDPASIATLGEFCSQPLVSSTASATPLGLSRRPYRTFRLTRARPLVGRLET
jgi:hypothetical protein